jgi:hypothetical protein
MTGNSVTIEQVRANMQDVIVRTLQDFEKPCTYVTVRMLNGFTLRESTTCVDPANYDEEIGKQICLKKIEDKIWYLLGYALQDKIANTPKDYKERMMVEWKELQVRISNLAAFFMTDLFKSLPEEKKTLMERQHKVMVEYRQILAETMKLENVPL